MNLETVMMRGLRIGNELSVKGDIVDLVVNGQLHTGSVILDINESSITIQDEFYGPVTLNISDIETVKKSGRKATIKTNAGEIRVNSREDMDIPGIDIAFVPEQYDTPIDLVSIESPGNTQDMSVYVYSDVYSEEWTHKETIRRKDVCSALNQEKEDAGTRRLEAIFD